MKVATKFVSALSPGQIQHLEDLAQRDSVRRVRMRAHSILLSSRGSSIDEIARIYQVHRDTVSSRYIRKLWTGIKNERILEYQQNPKSLSRGRKDTLHDTIYTLRSRKDSQR